MRKRLQVMLEEEELGEVRRAARLARISAAEWVRSALRAGCLAATAGASNRKLAVVRAAVQHDFPTGDIGTMLAEIHAYPGLERISS